MIERSTPADGALVIHPLGPDSDIDRSAARLEEAAGLAEALDLTVLNVRTEPVRRIDSGQYFGRGKVDEIKSLADDLDARIVIVDTALTPIQQRNLERAWNAKVIDRTGLILEIFGQRAQTREGRLQVELARLSYERSRLVRTWTHLERQRGGRGFLAGPGETQIETDRRLLQDRMAKIRKELSSVTRTRELHRQKRRAAPWPVVALVGYTNAGKSTLFNRLARESVLAKDMPFATLDPTMRAVKTNSGRKILLADTVGFITDLPTELIAAFRATLEEVVEADVIIHVRDMSDPDHEGRKIDVEGVLDQIDAGQGKGQTVIEAWNKTDRLSKEDREDLIWKARLPVKTGQPERCVISAITGDGIDDLMTLIDDALSADEIFHHFTLEPKDAEALAWLHENGEILSEKIKHETGSITLKVRLNAADSGRFKTRFAHIAKNSAKTEVAE